MLRYERGRQVFWDLVGPILAAYVRCQMPDCASQNAPAREATRNAKGSWRIPHAAWRAAVGTFCWDETLEMADENATSTAERLPCSQRTRHRAVASASSRSRRRPADEFVVSKLPHDLETDAHVDQKAPGTALGA